ncbi:MAG: hypothetical protein ABL962_19525 [Fimbriimonadaceae bacterium]
METVRYTTAKAVRWLETGAQGMRFVANAQGRSLVRREGERTIGRDVLQAAGAIADYGKSAWADILHTQAQSTEYLLSDDALEISGSGRTRTIPFTEILSIRLRGDKATVVMERGSVNIRPEAYISSGRIKVPIGWERNEIEVPYEMLIDELAARAGIKVQME